MRRTPPYEFIVKYPPRGGTQRGNSKAEAQNTEKIQVLLVGDSQLRNVKGEKLSNDNRDIEIRCKPGLRIEQTSAQVGKTDSDVIVVHVGTNNVKSYSPQKLARMTSRLTLKSKR